MKKLIAIVVLVSTWQSLRAHSTNSVPSQLPLVFRENSGQITDQHYAARPDIQFSVATGKGLNIFVGDGAIHYQFNAQGPQRPGCEKPSAVSMYRLDVRLVGANMNAKIETQQQVDYTEFHYNAGTGEKGAKVRSFGKVTYREIYPNIDWVLYTKDGKLKHEFLVREGGDVNSIRLKYEGATSISILPDGGILATTPQGNILENAPISYDESGKKITSKFALDRDILSYKTGSYSGAITIDPTLSWATYYGGDSADNFCSIARDTAGNVYVSGNTKSLSTIVTAGAWQTTLGGGTDAFVVKFNGAGTRIWATYVGGTSSESGDGVAVDPAGNVYVCGMTSSATIMGTTGAWQASPGGGLDGFLEKFDAGGARVWGTYYGGSAHDMASTNGITADAAGNIYVVGTASSTTAIASSTAWQTSIGGASDGFLVKFDGAGTRLWGTYYGGAADDGAYNVSADGSGNVYVTGITKSTTSIASAGAWQLALGGIGDAFLAKFDASGTRIWGSYYGGTGQDWADAVTTDLSGNVYITGRTMSPLAIASATAYQPVYAGSTDAFLAKFSSTGTVLWGTYYGDAGGDYANSIATDLAGNVYIAGFTGSTTGLSTPGAYQAVNGGGTDAFLAQFSGTGTRLWATYFGGTATDQAFSLTTDQTGVYMAGLTSSTASIATTGGYATTYGGGNADGFLCKFSIATSYTPDETSISSQSQVLVYPNPATTQLDFHWRNGLTGKATITFVDVTGCEVMKKEITSPEASLDISELVNGIYTVRITSKDLNTVRKITVIK